MSGAGVLIADSVVLTCAHVVADAFGIDATDSPPGGQVSIDFAAGDFVGDWHATVRPGGWFPARSRSGDVAVLDLDRCAPGSVRPARFGNSVDSGDRALAAFGHPRSAPDGLWAEVRMVGRGGGDPAWVQIDGVRTTGARIEQGFSGAAVSDTESDAVVGIVVAEYTAPDSKTAWMLPTEALTDYWPPLRQLLVAPTPAGTIRLSSEQVSELVDALLAISALQDPHIRQAVLQQLRPAISSSAPSHPRARIALLGLVKTCLDYDGGLAELVEAVRSVDPESAPSLSFQALAVRLLPRDVGFRDGS